MSDSKIHAYFTESEATSDAPPSYTAAAVQPNASPPQSRAANPFSDPSSSYPHPLPSTFKPIVIPQTQSSSSATRGAFFSPFTRAYSSSLATLISTKDFISFLDSLNEAFVPGTGSQITSYAGSFISAIPLPIVGLAGKGLSASAGAASGHSSRSKAARVLDQANRELFAPKGLRVEILRTARMMEAVGHGAQALNLPPVEYVPLGEEGGGVDDPRMRRVRALGNRVAPLTLDGLPAQGELQGWWKKRGVKEAQRQDRKVLQRQMEERELAMYGDTRRGHRRRERDDGLLSKDGSAEHVAAQKCYWIVIDRAEKMEQEFGGHDDLQSLDVEGVESR